ncbi:MAG: 5'-nucleotidase C-terminal domain-containing protein [Bacillota bacterium]|nr:5'-nucleotidase C-terminal domain-containing protein [Bacillota bacterium]
MRKTMTRLLGFVLALGLFCGLIPTAVILAADEPDIKQVYILHTNDMHGRAIGDNGPGKDGLPVLNGSIGYSRYKTLIDTLREVNEDRVIVLDAGDTTHGTNFASLSKGQSIIRLMNDLGVAAMTLGNHEFNYGQRGIEQLANEADFPLLAANIVTEDGECPYDEQLILEVDGLRIGIFGVSTPETKVKASPKYTAGLEFVDPAITAAEQVELLEEETDAIIMLAHLGMDAESVYTSTYVVDQVDGIDVILDGHSHHVLPEGERYNETLICQTGNYLENVGLVTLTFTDGELTETSAQLISFLAAQQYAPDEDIDAAIAAIEAENQRITSVEVGELATKLDGEREDVRTRETNLGNLIADAMLDATGADVVITNGGGIRASIEAGTITMGDLLTVLPFGNMVTMIEVTGADIRAALEFGTDSYPETAGKFPHVAGMSYELHAGDDGYTVENIKVGDADLDDKATYKLATNDFMAEGGDGYEMFAHKPLLLLEGLMVDILCDYIEAQIAESGALDVAVDGRITVVE